MTDMDDRKRGAMDRGPLTLGLALVVVGGIFLVAQFVNIDVGEAGWPVFVIVPGVALLAAGLAARGPLGIGLSVAGAIVTSTGLLLAFQNTYDYFASWAYAWALVAPGSVGLALVLHGLAHREPSVVRGGFPAFIAGLVLFAIFAAFFEGVIGLSGNRSGPLARAALPVTLVGVGLILIVVALFRRRTPYEHQDLTEPPVDAADDTNTQPT